jgi:hypothetical protein
MLSNQKHTERNIEDIGQQIKEQEESFNLMFK